MYLDFEYANHRLSDFGCIICSIGSGKSGSYEVEIGSDITFTTIKNNQSSKYSKTSSSYEEVYKAEFQIAKYDCSTRKCEFLTSLESRAIVKWLSRHEYHKAKFLNKLSEESDVQYFGSFNVKQVMLGENIIGLTLTFTSNAPFGFASAIKSKYMMLNENDVITVVGDSDEYGKIYPKIEIKCFSDGELDLLNLTTEKHINIKNCKKNEVITIDGEHKVIFSSDESHTTLPNDFNYEYFYILVNEDLEENQYSSTLPCELTVSYLPVRKVGVI